MTQRETQTFDRIASPYDRGMAPLEKLWLKAMRSRLVPLARGRVLEVGVGTGANLPFYQESVCITVVDESADMLSLAAKRAAALKRCVFLSQVDVEHLSFPSGYFDTIVVSLVLCSVVDLNRALMELRRVLHSPDGQLLLLEHMRPKARPLAWLADLANRPWFAFNGRCHLNRETQDALVDAGFAIRRVESKVGGLLRLFEAQANSQGPKATTAR